MAENNALFVSRRRAIVLASAGLASLAGCASSAGGLLIPKPGASSLSGTTGRRNTLSSVPAITPPLSVVNLSDGIAVIDSNGTRVFAVQLTENYTTFVGTSAYVAQPITIPVQVPQTVGETVNLGSGISVTGTGQDSCAGIAPGNSSASFSQPTSAAGTLLTNYSGTQLAPDQFVMKNYFNGGGIGCGKGPCPQFKADPGCGLAAAGLVIATIALVAAILAAGAQLGIDPLADAAVYAAWAAWNIAYAEYLNDCQPYMNL